MSTVLCKDGVKRFSFVGPAFLLIPTHRHWEGPRVPRVSEARILSVILNVYQCYLFLADVEVYLTHQKKVALEQVSYTGEEDRIQRSGNWGCRVRGLEAILLVASES